MLLTYYVSGVCHGDDLLYPCLYINKGYTYLFNKTFLFPTYQSNATDIHLQKIMTTIWANFARTG